ncbi:MAG: DUF6691 family protein [Xanthobacteraceae bacterium]|jgi:uncharacterized membrane protein YedE/YeeE
MRTIVAALAAGVVFGTGLTVSGMIEPRRVLGFLDVFGHWDPTLAIVMAAALVVVMPGFALLKRRGAPLFASAFAWPDRTGIDRPLVAGAALFGVGWGLVGLCPGPALVNLATLSPKVFAFVVAMAIGAGARDMLSRSRAPRPQPA